MEAESEGKFTDLQVHQRWKIPRSTIEMRHTIFFSSTLVTCNVMLAINPSLPKLAKRISDLWHQLAIIYYNINLHPFLMARKDDLCNLDL